MLALSGVQAPGAHRVTPYKRLRPGTRVIVRLHVPYRLEDARLVCYDGSAAIVQLDCDSTIERVPDPATDMEARSDGRGVAQGALGGRKVHSAGG